MFGRLWTLPATVSARLVLLAAAVGLLTPCGCQNGSKPGDASGAGSGRTQFISIGTAPVGGAFQVVGGAIAEMLNQHKGDNNWKVQAKGTKGSQENIRRLAKGELQLALSNSAITYFAVRGEAGWEQKYDVRAVVTMAPNVAMFITTRQSGIKSIADLKGKRVIVGPAGAGFEMFVGPILEEHGVRFEDFTKLNDTQSGAVDSLADGNADAAFLGGALPTGAIVQACSQLDVYFIPYDPQARQRLIEKYPFFQPVTIKKDVYADLEADFEGLDVGSMHLITYATQPDDLIYDITRTIWEHRADIKHPAAKFINERNAARDTGTPFHPAAERFYREIGIWPEASGAAAAASGTDDTADNAGEDRATAAPEQ